MFYNHTKLLQGGIVERQNIHTDCLNIFSAFNFKVKEEILKEKTTFRQLLEAYSCTYFWLFAVKNFNWFWPKTSFNLWLTDCWGGTATYFVFVHLPDMAEKYKITNNRSQFSWRVNYCESYYLFRRSSAIVLYTTKMSIRNAKETFRVGFLAMWINEESMHFNFIHFLSNIWTCALMPVHLLHAIDPFPPSTTAKYF